MSEAIRHAKGHRKSINYLLYPSTALRDGSWERQKRKMIALGGKERKTFNTKSMLFDNGSAIEFITTNFIMPDKKMIGYEKQFIFVDNLECFYPANAGIRSMRSMFFPILTTCLLVVQMKRMGRSGLWLTTGNSARPTTLMTT
jgi:hypothetical protein